jgi:hypothetical protein
MKKRCPKCGQIRPWQTSRGRITLRNEPWEVWYGGRVFAEFTETEGRLMRALMRAGPHHSNSLCQNLPNSRTPDSLKPHITSLRDKLRIAFDDMVRIESARVNGVGYELQIEIVPARLPPPIPVAKAAVKPGWRAKPKPYEGTAPRPWDEPPMLKRLQKKTALHPMAKRST